MQVIHLHHPYDPKQIPAGPVVLALGFFDGVHRGHQAVIAKAKSVARQEQIPLALMTFNQHPAIVFQQLQPGGIHYLSPLDRKTELMAKNGVNILYIVDFTSQLANLLPQTFVNDYIVALHAQTVVAGFDYTFGKKAIANMQTLPKFSQDRFNIVTVREQDDHKQKISSSRIRQLLDQGDVDAANHLLGYIYQTTGLVVHGLARGRTLGFPTANIMNTQQQKIPGIGIYAVKIKVLNQWYEGMASIGRNITFGDTAPVTVEINILNFSDDIYGENVLVDWYHFLRGEIKFSGANALVAQLKQDRQDTRNYFTKIRKA